MYGKNDEPQSEAYDSGQHREAASAPISDGREGWTKHADEIASGYNLRKRGEFHAQSACKDCEKWVDHTVHGIENCPQNHENDKLKAKAHMEYVLK